MPIREKAKDALARDLARVDRGGATASYLRGARPTADFAAAASFVPAYGVTLSLATVTLDNFIEVLLRQEVTQQAFRTLLLPSGKAAIITALLALAIAYSLERALLTGRLLAEGLLGIPNALPGVVVAMPCILLAHFQALALQAPLAAMAATWQRLHHIVVPQLLPGWPSICRTMSFLGRR